MFTLDTPLSKITYISPRFLKSLEKLGLRSVRDLVFHFPSRYEDFSQIYNISDLEPSQQATICGTISEVNLRRSWRRRMTIVEAIIEDETGSIRAVWFNQPYLKNTLRPGRLMNFSGKVSVTDNEIYLSHPDYEFASGDERQETKHTGRLVPIYPETRGLTSRGLRFVVQPILNNLESLEEFLPKKILETEDLPEINEAIQKIHFPDRIEEVNAIKKRFAFQDLFLLQLFNVQQKLKLAKEKAQSIPTDIEYLKKILGFLPFELTQSQKKSLWEIIKDLEKPQPMNRLLQGDVGSGKTIVAALASLIAAKNNLQSAFMAPTEVLANQHFKTIQSFFLNISEKDPRDELPAVGILTSSGARLAFPDGLETELKKSEMLKKIKAGEVKVLIGTHSLIQKTVEFQKLGLVIVDEQHRFGIKQRAELLTQNGRDRLVPHFLSMSATPIPRTVMLTIFGDLDISIIDELPKGRKVIDTKIIPPNERGGAYDFIREQVKSGRQTFVICPRIEKNEDQVSLRRQGSGGQASVRYQAYDPGVDVKTVKEEYEKLSTKIFPDLRVGMLHGKLKPKEKGKIMADFKAGKIQILVSTSVIEVGVDVPNATIMMIEGAERFGLAQLYQFRGRVGRGEHKSFCFLFTDSEAETTKKRLLAIVNAKSGFELAEKDLKLRGPGEFLGTSQTGLPDIAMEALQNMDLVKSSREAAVGIIKTDPSLKKNPALKKRLDEFQRRIHQE